RPALPRHRDPAPRQQPRSFARSLAVLSLLLARTQRLAPRRVPPGTSICRSDWPNPFTLTVAGQGEGPISCHAPQLDRRTYGLIPRTLKVRVPHLGPADRRTGWVTDLD